MAKDAFSPVLQVTIDAAEEIFEPGSRGDFQRLSGKVKHSWLAAATAFDAKEQNQSRSV
ncbi:MAG: hypothetical protein ABI548_17620 [Polyangiaceae bacterium]